MAGGTRGPVPKRSDQRRRRNDTGSVDQAASVPSDPPAADEKWHPVARQWYESLIGSGQAVFYEASDWATAYVIAEAMSRELNPQPLVVGRGADAFVDMVTLPPKGASLTAWLKAMTALMVTEGDRRRVRLELQKVEPDPEEEGAARVAKIDDFRKRLSS